MKRKKRRVRTVWPIEWTGQWPGHSDAFWHEVALLRKKRRIKSMDFDKINTLVEEIKKEELKRKGHRSA